MPSASRDPPLAPHVHHPHLVAPEDARARRVGVREVLPICRHERRLVGELVEARNGYAVVRRPVALVAGEEEASVVGGDDVSRAGELVEHPERAWPQRLPGREELVVDHVPLVVIRPGVLAAEGGHPLGARRGEAVRDSVACPLEDGPAG